MWYARSKVYFIYLIILTSSCFMFLRLLVRISALHFGYTAFFSCTFRPWLLMPSYKTPLQLIRWHKSKKMFINKATDWYLWNIFICTRIKFFFTKDNTELTNLDLIHRLFMLWVLIRFSSEKRAQTLFDMAVKKKHFGFFFGNESMQVTPSFF